MSLILKRLEAPKKEDAWEKHLSEMKGRNRGRELWEGRPGEEQHLKCKERKKALGSNSIVLGKHTTTGLQTQCLLLCPEWFLFPDYKVTMSLASSTPVCLVNHVGLLKEETKF